MTDKRRGLGRGLGALIPNTTEPTRVTRPTDVFFTESKREGAPDAAPSGDGAQARSSRFSEALTPRPSYREGRETEPRTESRATSHRRDDLAAAAAAVTQPAGQAPPVSRETEAARLEEKLEESATSTAETAAEGTEQLAPVPGAEFAELAPQLIRPNPKQPRAVFDEEHMAELVHSIREIGVLQPIVVRPVPHDDPAHRTTPYELIMGERRWRASQHAGLDAVPAIIRSTTDEDLLRDALLENLHRSQLNPLEEAAAYAQLLEDFGCTHDELAARIGRSRPQISNTIRLMKLPPAVQRRVAAGVLSAGHARALLGLSDQDAMDRLAQRIVAEGLSVRATEEIVALGEDKKPRSAPVARETPPVFDEWATHLSDKLDTRVGITMGKNKGKLTVEFASVDDLDRIMDALGIDRG